MHIRLYSSQSPDREPTIFTKAELISPTLSTLQQLLNAIASPSLTVHAFFIACTLWITCACDAVQIFGLGFFLSALSVDVDKQPVPWPPSLFPVNNIFSLDSGQLSTLSAVVYLGMLIGGLLSAPLDKYNGSRPALLSCSLVSFLGYLGSAESPNFLILAIFQAIIGLSLGIRVPIVYSNAASLFPGASVGFVITTISLTWVIFSIYSSFMGWITIGYGMMHQSWRLYLLFLSIPSLFSLILGIFFAYEPMLYDFYYACNTTGTIALLKAHYGTPVKLQCLHVLYNTLCCGGICCCGKKLGKRSGRAALKRYNNNFEDNDGDLNNQNNNNDGYNNMNYSSEYSSMINTMTQSPQLVYNHYDYVSDGKDSEAMHEYRKKRKPSMFQEDVLFNHNIILQQQAQQQQISQTYQRPSISPENLLDQEHTPSFAQTPTQSYGGTSFNNDEYMPPNFSHFHRDSLVPQTDNNNGHLMISKQSLTIPTNNLGFQPSSLPSPANRHVSYNNVPSSHQHPEIDQYESNVSFSSIDREDINVLPRHLITTVSTSISVQEPPKFGFNKDQKEQLSVDWNIDIDNQVNMDEFFDFLSQNWIKYTAQLSSYYKKHKKHYIDIISQDPNHPHNHLALEAPQPHLDDDVAQIQLTLSDSSRREESSLSRDNSNINPVALEPDFDGNKADIPRIQTNSGHGVVVYGDRRSVTILIILLSIIWFVVSFGSAGFSSFLPKMWDRLLPNVDTENSDSKYIVSIIYSAIQVPSNILNAIIITRVSPPKLLLISTSITFFAIISLAVLYQYNIWVAMGCILLFQSALSTCWASINYVAVRYFDDHHKVLAFSIQASVGKTGAIIAQYAFGYLIDQSTFALLLVTAGFLLISALSDYLFMRFVTSTRPKEVDSLTLNT